MIFKIPTFSFRARRSSSSSWRYASCRLGKRASRFMVFSFADMGPAEFYANTKPAPHRSAAPASARAAQIELQLLDSKDQVVVIVVAPAGTSRGRTQIAEVRAHGLQSAGGKREGRG